VVDNAVGASIVTLDWLDSCCWSSNDNWDDGCGWSWLNGNRHGHHTLILIWTVTLHDASTISIVLNKAVGAGIVTLVHLHVWWHWHIVTLVHWHVWWHWHVAVSFVLTLVHLHVWWHWHVVTLHDACTIAIMLNKTVGAGIVTLVHLHVWWHWHVVTLHDACTIAIMLNKAVGASIVALVHLHVWWHWHVAVSFVLTLVHLHVWWHWHIVTLHDACTIAIMLNEAVGAGIVSLEDGSGESRAGEEEECCVDLHGENVCEGVVW
jgi:hypothetical protein